jgi:hypothetical protein
MRTLIDKIIRGAIYIERKDVSLYGISKKSVTSIRRDLIIGLLSFFKTIIEKTERISPLTS